ncbi:hypothetical protein [Arcobacter sp.]|jgi:hypothetical protein|uniref:hypothetical protein n=1 Tax=Arcobacter sp. TaxID=1872629 RepID=UPI003D0EC700
MDNVEANQLIRELKRQNDLKVLEIEFLTKQFIKIDKDYLRDFVKKRLDEIEYKYK